MSSAPSPRPHRRVRSVPVQLNFQITPLSSIHTTYPPPTSGTATPSSTESPSDVSNSRKRQNLRGSRSAGGRSPVNQTTSTAYEDHPSIGMKRSSSTFFLSSLPSYQHDWTFRHGARVAAESLEEQGRSWLVTRASSTDLTGLAQRVLRHDHEDSGDDDPLYHRYTRDLEILDVGEALYGDLDGEEEEEEGYNWTKWVKTFMDFGDESDDELEWEKPPRHKSVTFDVPKKDVDENIVARARERDDEHGLDGWMDGAAYLGFLGVRALGAFF